MATQHSLRLLVIAPVARVATVAGWLNNNVGPDTVSADLGPGLSATGAAPATHHWCCAAFRDEESRLILRQLCQLASVTPPTPAQWAGWTRAQKIVWLRGVEAAIRTGYGVLVRMADNEGAWDDPQGALAALGLQVISAGP